MDLKNNIEEGTQVSTTAHTSQSLDRKPLISRCFNHFVNAVTVNSDIRDLDL